MSFEMAHAFTARWEGGLTDHPADPGGITNHGVSLRWLQHISAQAVANCHRSFHNCDNANAPYTDDISAHTKKQAAELMRRHFWKPLRCDALPAPMGVALYDAATNLGNARAARLLQHACNIVGEAHLDEFTPLAEDGRCGPLTIAVASALYEAGLDFYTARLCVRQRRDFYVRLCRQKILFEPFLKDWINRCNALLKYLTGIEVKEGNP